MKKKILMSMLLILSVLFISCKKDEIKTERNIFKVEITNSENVNFYNEIIVFQINDDNAANVSVTNTDGFEIMTTQGSKTLQITRKGSMSYSLQTQQAVKSVSLALGFLLDNNSINSDTELFPFTCTIKVYKDNKLIDTKTHSIDKNTIETFTSFYY